MNQIYKHENYEIKINKMSDSVYIEFYDNNLYKTFSNTFLDIDIVTITGKSIDTFYTVMNTVFSALIDKDYEKSILNIILFNKQIKLDIHHKYYIDIKFELELNLNKEDSSNDKNICFKKLEDKIKLLEIKNNELQNYIYNYMSINIATCSQHNIFIPCNTHHIKFINYKSIGRKIEIINGNCIINSLCKNSFTDHKIKLACFNKEFLGVKCKTLELELEDCTCYSEGKFRNENVEEKIKIWSIFESYLPLSVEKLIINNYNNMYKFELPNLINLELIDCTFEFIYEKILHLKTLKNITIQRCNNFKECELLISKGYNIQMLA